MIYGGIDYSLQCPCLCVYDSSLGELSHDTCHYYFQQYKVSDKEIERRSELKLKNIHPSTQYLWKDEYHRYLGLADYFLSILLQYRVEVVAMEDYALGAKGRVFNIAECTGVLKQLMTLVGIKFYTFPPMYVKKVFSGKGNAMKEDMGNMYKTKYGVDISSLFEKDGNWDSPISDIVDSHAMLYTYFNGFDNEKYGVVNV
jgi:Holliday junction resolvasome RuvABC endonuclease subunit